MPGGRIGFYTFQTLSYTIDIYRRKIKPYESAWGFAMYVSFFPQLVAGPIVRAADFLPQISAAIPFQRQRSVVASELILFGLFKKMVIADGVSKAVLVAYYPAGLEAMPAGMLVLGTLLFTLQIYCDFSGYTDIARGLAYWLGYDIPHNFRWPYLATSPQGFWQRWHMSLSFWIRDYLYISLGGSRKGTVRTLFNLFITMALAGLWHGANWRFVAWGLFYGVWLVLHRIYRMAVDKLGIGKVAFPLRVLYSSVCLVFTFCMVNVGWILFRAEDLTTAWAIITRIFTWAPSTQDARLVGLEWHELLGYVSRRLDLGLTTMILIVICIPIHCLCAYKYRDGMILSACPRFARPVLIAAGILVIVLFAKQAEPFIYFAF